MARRHDSRGPRPPAPPRCNARRVGLGTTWAECDQLVSTWWVRADCVASACRPALGSRRCCRTDSTRFALTWPRSACGLGAAAACTHSTIRASIAYILADSEAALLIAATPAQWRGIGGARPRAAGDAQAWCSWRRRRRGRRRLTSGRHREAFGSSLAVGGAGKGEATANRRRRMSLRKATWRRWSTCPAPPASRRG